MSTAATLNPAADPDQLLTPQQTADLLATTTGTLSVWRCTARHPLPYMKLGTAVRYRRADVLAFIEARTVRPGDEADNS